MINIYIFHNKEKTIDRLIQKEAKTEENKKAPSDNITLEAL